MRILLVADPQLIGYHNEVIKFLSPLTIWDSDRLKDIVFHIKLFVNIELLCRYLVNTYNHAFEFAKPEVVIFLGDLFDEGSTGSDEEFNLYVRRLFNIFLNDKYPNVKVKTNIRYQMPVT